jgi:gas vesicle protein
MSKKKGLGKFILGAAVGAGLGVLFAPKSGEETRKELKKSLNELIDNLKELDKEEVKKNIMNKIEDIKDELQDLDQEKVAAIAKKQADNIKKKAQELVEYAKEKGTPVLEKSAQKVKDQTIKTLEATLDKLKDSNNTKKTTK